MGNPNSKSVPKSEPEKKQKNDKVVSQTATVTVYRHVESTSNINNNFQQFLSDNNNNNVSVSPKKTKQKKKADIKFEILDPTKLFSTGVRVKCFCLKMEEVMEKGTLEAFRTLLAQKEWRLPRVVLTGSYSNGKSFLANLLEKAGFKEGPHPTTHHIQILLCKGYLLMDTAGFNAFTDRTCNVQEREAQDYIMRQVLFALADWMIYLTRDLKKIEDVKAIKEIVIKNNFNSKSSKNILVVSNLLRITKYSEAKDIFYTQVRKLGEGCPRATEVFIEDKATKQIQCYIVEWWESYGDCPNDFPNWKGSYHIFLMKNEGEGAVHNRFVAKLLKKFLRNGPSHSISERNLLDEFTTVLTRTVPDKLKLNSAPSLLFSEVSHTTLLLEGKCQIPPVWRETRLNKKDYQMSGEIENEVGLHDDNYCVIIRATEISVKRLFDAERGTILEISGERRSLDDMMMEEVEGELPTGSFSIRLQIPPQFKVTKRMVTENAQYEEGSWILSFPRKKPICIQDLLKEGQQPGNSDNNANHVTKTETDEWEIHESWNESDCQAPFDKPIQISIQSEYDHVPERLESHSTNSGIVPYNVSLSKDHQWLIRIWQPTTLGVKVDYIQNKTCVIFFGEKKAPLKMTKNFVKKSQYGPFEIVVEVPHKYSVSEKIIRDNKFDPKDFIRVFSFPQKKPFEVKLSKLASEVVDNGENAPITTEDWQMEYAPLDEPEAREARYKEAQAAKEKKEREKQRLEDEKNKKKNTEPKPQPTSQQAEVEPSQSLDAPVVRPKNIQVPPLLETYLDQQL